MGPAVRAGGVVRFPEFEIPAVDPRDIGACAARVLAEPDGTHHAGMVYEVSGPERLTTRGITEAIAAGIGRPLRHEPVQVEDAAAALPPFLAELFRAMGKDSSIIPSSDTVQRLTGRPGTTMEQWAREHAHLFAADKPKE